MIPINVDVCQRVGCSKLMRMSLGKGGAKGSYFACCDRLDDDSVDGVPVDYMVQGVHSGDRDKIQSRPDSCPFCVEQVIGLPE